MTKRWVVTVVLGGAIAALGCSSSDDQDANDGDAGNTAGTNGGGTAGTGATSGTGGTGAGAGTGGGAGAGNGSTGNPAACPAQAPSDDGACSMPDLECSYGAMECACEAEDEGGTAAWDCDSFGGGSEQECPAAEPDSGDSCTPGRGDCTFGDRVCECVDDSNTWACWDPADCPASRPMEQASCDLVGMECEYEEEEGGGQGFGGGDDCDCEESGWDCGGLICPDSEPAMGGECEGGDGLCMYGSRVCDCARGSWACWDPADCPATPPAEDSACTIEGMECEYSGGECDCEDAAWECDDEITGGDDEDAGT